MSQSERGDPAARPCEEFRGGLAFIHNIPPPPPRAGPRAWRLGLRLHTALFTEGRFRAPRAGLTPPGCVSPDAQATSLDHRYRARALGAALVGASP